LSGLALVGTSDFMEWLARLRGIQSRWHIYNASGWGVADRLFTMHPYSQVWPPIANFPTLAPFLTLLLLGIVAITLWRRARKADIDCSYAVFGLASLLMSPLGWLYYLPAFLGPIVVTLGRRPPRGLWAFAALTAWPYLLLIGRLHGK